MFVRTLTINTIVVKTLTGNTLDNVKAACSPTCLVLVIKWRTTISPMANCMTSRAMQSGTLCISASGQVCFFAIASPPPCGTFSRVRNVPGGPPPLRGVVGVERYGLKTLPKRDADTVRAHNLLAQRTAMAT